jgi:hypothetical protein
MESVYHIVTIRVNEISWAHVWRLHSRYLRMGHDSPREDDQIQLLRHLTRSRDGALNFVLKIVEFI